MSGTWWQKTDRDIKGIFWRGYERDSSKHEAVHHAKMLQSTAWLMTILHAKNITVGIVASCSRRGLDLEPSIPAEIAYYTHGTVITQNRRWKYLLLTTTSKIAIRHHHQNAWNHLTHENDASPWHHVALCSLAWASLCFVIMCHSQTGGSVWYE